MTRKQLTDQELDALVVRALSRLPAHAPSPLFARNVMSRVQLPQPKAVTVWRRARSWALEPRRALALAGGYAVIATIALAVTVPWLLQQMPAVGFASQWAAGQLLAAVRDVTLTAASWAVSSGLAGWVRSVPLTGPQLWLGGVLLTVGYAGCAVGLHLLLRAPKVPHAALRIDA